MEETKKTGSKTVRLLKLLLKIVISALCLWYVSTKIDFQQAFAALKDANWIYLAGALLFFIISKWIAAIRLNIYFGNIGIQLPPAQNLMLYWLGMCYNLFLPGSISGDAYKVIRLSKKYGVHYRKTTVSVLLDRFSGLLGLGLILAVYSIAVLKETWLVILIVLGALIAVIAFYFIINRYFKDFKPSFFSTLTLGTMVQASQVICAYLIMASLDVPAHVTEYIFLFLVSSVVSVLPLTIGGLGIREVVFLEGARYFHLEASTAVLISLLFYLITVFTSAWGMIFIFIDPLSDKKKDPLVSP